MTNKSHEAVDTPEMKLFEGERVLVILGLIGFVLAACIAVYIGINGSVILPEGNAWSAFSFDAAVGIFLLSIAAILPLSGLNLRKRKMVRWFFIVSFLYNYAVETLQHFRGINPRFSQVGTVGDGIAGALFGLDALLIVVVTMLLAIPYFRQKKANERPLVVLGIRYAFLSLMFAFAAGIWMIIVQGRFTGTAGNLIILHGLGFHALQTLPLLGWMTERTQIAGKQVSRLIHVGSIAWTISIVLIFIQTMLGDSVFEWTTLPILACVLLLIWVATASVAAYWLMKVPLKIDSQTPHSL